MGSFNVVKLTIPTETTSRDRAKSAPYLRLKNSNRLQYVKVLVSWGPFYEKHFWKKSLTMPKKTERVDLLGVFNIHFVAKHQKIEGGHFREFFLEKKSHNAEKKLKGGTLWSRPVWYVTRENRKDHFGSVR